MCDYGDCSTHNRIDFHWVDGEYEDVSIISYRGAWAVVTQVNYDLTGSVVDKVISLAMGEEPSAEEIPMYETMVIRLKSETACLGDNDDAEYPNEYIHWREVHDNFSQAGDVHDMVLGALKEGLLDLSSEISD